MADKHVILFTTVADFFKDNMNQLQRGENSYRSGNVDSLIFDNDVKPAILKGRVSASMKKKTYNVEVDIDTENDCILTARCTCPRGLAVCHHMAALCIYAHHNLSVTDKLCSWAAPSTSAVGDVVKVANLFTKSSKKEVIREDCPDGNRANFTIKLGTSNVVGFTWLLKQKNSRIKINNLLPYIEDLIFSKEYMEAPDKKKFMLDKCQLTDEQINEILLKTVGQSKNANWLIARKHRITASNFGAVLAAVKRKRFPPSLFRRLVDGYDLSSVLSVQWGREHEIAAIDDFALAYSEHEVTPTGFWLQPNGLLGASPDGLYGESAIIEVKCPYKFRNSSLTEALKTDRTYIIFKDEENIILNKKHEYYDQIQGQLHITNRDICYLVIWTPDETEIVSIDKDETWKINLDILLSFYMEHFIPYISKMK